MLSKDNMHVTVRATEEQRLIIMMDVPIFMIQNKGILKAIEILQMRLKIALMESLKDKLKRMFVIEYMRDKAYKAIIRVLQIATIVILTHLIWR